MRVDQALTLVDYALILGQDLVGKFTEPTHVYVDFYGRAESALRKVDSKSGRLVEFERIKAERHNLLNDVTPFVQILKDFRADINAGYAYHLTRTTDEFASRLRRSMMRIDRIQVKHILSFGARGIDISLRPLNVFIGANGSGKSNLIDIFRLVASSSNNLFDPMKRRGPVSTWYHQTNGVFEPAESDDFGNGCPFGKLYCHPATLPELTYEHWVTWDWSNGSYMIDEHLYESTHDGALSSRNCLYENGINGLVALAGTSHGTAFTEAALDSQQSAIPQLRGPANHPIFSWFFDQYRNWGFYDAWEFGRTSRVRRAQPTDGATDRLDEQSENLGLMISAIMRNSTSGRRFLECFSDAYDGIEDIRVVLNRGAAEISIQEKGGCTVSASRISDGTLRYLMLLVLLLQPKPPALVCIEEPELGLHPDLVVRVADLLKEASTRMQLVVTTHSDMLLDALSDTPESIVVCSKENGETVMTRLDADELAPYLEEQTLSSLWSSGQLGGRRW